MSLDISLDEFNSQENCFYPSLQDIPMPQCFNYVFNIFMEIYNHSKEMITWCDIQAYEEVRCVKLQQVEIDYIIKINNIANSQINEMQKGE